MSRRQGKEKKVGNLRGLRGRERKTEKQAGKTLPKLEQSISSDFFRK